MEVKKPAPGKPGGKPPGGKGGKKSLTGMIEQHPAYALLGVFVILGLAYVFLRSNAATSQNAAGTSGLNQGTATQPVTDTSGLPSSLGSETGPAGPAGPKGARGKTGARGKQGKRGPRGRPPVKKKVNRKMWGANPPRPHNHPQASTATIQRPAVHSTPPARRAVSASGKNRHS